MPKKELCLGIESTADDFGVGVVSSDGEILANVSDAYTPIRGGIHPREAARHHAKVAWRVIRRALEKAGVKARDVDVFAFSQGPGMGPCLRTGATVARALSVYFNAPLAGVNHCVAHIEIGRLLTDCRDPIALYVSGGNTLVSGFEDGRYRIYGETLDIAVGNCLDVFAREVRLPYPGGPALEKMAERGKELVPLPYAVKGMDPSFSGLLTAATEKLREGVGVEDLSFSLQETVFSMLAEITERALAHTGKSEVLLTGGVATNKRLQSIMKCMVEERGGLLHVVPKEYAIDNGAMISYVGLLMFGVSKVTPIEKSGVRPKWRLDAVDIPWRESSQNLGL
ncbi:MAG: bifunctional N(6)-L-threonylcarbamoyladenine synthase/serine/threonine protein kinase [Candidatus Bathyarchaeia archaeon]